MAERPITVVVSVAVVVLALGACGDGAVGPESGTDGLRFDRISAGGTHTCGLDATRGQAYCWGENLAGKLGDGTTSQRNTPVEVDQSVLGGITFDQIVPGGSHTCGLDTSTGQAYCWGSNFRGQLGDGTTTTPRTPVAVDQSVHGGINLDQIAPGRYQHTCGLNRSLRQAYCWGGNFVGQLGDGTTNSHRTTPVAVHQSVLGGISFDQIVVGFQHTCGLDTSTGQAYCWGRNSSGQVGDGTTTSPRTPVAVDQSVLGGITFDQVAAGKSHTCGLDTSTGQAYCWGRNVEGQVGDGTTTSPRTTPVAVDQSVLGGIGFDQIAAGSSHACGLDTSSGQAYCWGNNPAGQLGDGTATGRTTPVAVDQSVFGGISFDQIAPGGHHTCGLDTSTGQAYCWGWNADGQVGDGTTFSRSTPRSVADGDPGS